MRRVTALMSAALILLASAASAQKPDFAGKWTVDMDKTTASNPNMPGGGGPPGGGMGGGRGGMAMGPMTVTMDAGTLTTQRETPNGAMSTTYKLDGSEQTIAQGQGEAQVKAAWDGNNLVINTTRSFNGNSMTTKAVWSLEGDYLVVTTTRPNRDGGEVTTKVFYKKG